MKRRRHIVGRIIDMILPVAFAGVAIGYVGHWLNISWMYWGGLVLAIPLFLLIPMVVTALILYFTYHLFGFAQDADREA